MFKPQRGLVQWNFRMLYSKWHTLLREVEHVENDGFIATILTMMDRVHHLDNRFTLMHNLLLAILTDDGQFALHQYTIVHHRMVVPTQLLSYRKFILHSYKLWPSPKRIVVQVPHIVPTRDVIG